MPEKLMFRKAAAVMFQCGGRELNYKEINLIMKELKCDV
jgi:hypothetical protein